MKAKGRSGLVLMLVVVLIAVIGAEMFVLTEVTRTMLFESSWAYLQAVERNLAASGVAWARRNVMNQSTETFNKAIELDVRGMNVPGSTLRVSIASREEVAEVQISTSCGRGRRTFGKNRGYRIEQ